MTNQRPTSKRSLNASKSTPEGLQLLRISLLQQVADPDYDAKLERAIVFHIEAWDSNCPQHISPRYTVDELAGHGFARA